MTGHLISFILMLFTVAALAQKKPEPIIKWKLVAELPAANDEAKSLGFAGPVVGVNNNVLIIAGGANFPKELPWEGGKKYYYNEIHILQKKNGKYFWNKKIKSTLPEAVAYCGNTSTSKGVVYAGGENENGISDKAYLVNWDNRKNEVVVRSLPNLPLALTNIALTSIDNVVYAAGGDEAKNSSKDFFSLDLNNDNPQWQVLPDLPNSIANASLITQPSVDGGAIFLIGGRTKTASGISDLHHEAFMYDVVSKSWESCADIYDGKNITNLSASTGIAIDKNYILMIGGDNGETFHKIETYISLIAKSGSPEEKAKLTEEKNALSIHHKGFFKGLLLYDVRLSTWKNIGEYPFLAQVTTTAVKWGNDIVVASGEIKPGVRTPNVIVGTIK